MVCRSVGLSISVALVSPVKTAKPIEMPFGFRTRVSPGNHVVDWGPDPPREGAILRGRESHCKLLGHSAVTCTKTAQPIVVSCAETAESIDLPFGLWTRVGQRKHKSNRIRQVAPIYPTTLYCELCKNG